MKAVVALIYKGDKILGVSRKDNPNDFGLVGGKCEDGEELIDALQREVLEETGLTITKHKCVFQRQDHGFESYTFLCEVEGEIKTTETGIVKEITWDDLFNGSFGNYNRQLYNQLQNG
jgi:8-oxo-dGTP pyrophosphatase MutT (NUDIX family)